MKTEKKLLENDYYLTGYIYVQDCNPNGDPDKDNMPRTDAIEGTGVMSDVSVKRAVRDYILREYEGVEGYDILEVEGTVKNSVIAEAKAKVGPKNPDDARSLLCDKYFDVRAFGSVLSTGPGGGCGRVYGPVQLGMVKSVDPIDITSCAITTQTVANDTQVTNGNTDTMGRKYFTPFGLYRFTFSVNKQNAKKSGFTEQDYEVLKEAIAKMYNMRMSSSKGVMGIAKLWEVKINSNRSCTGTAHVHLGFKATRKNTKVPARQLSEYNFSISDKLLKDDKITITELASL